MTNVLSIDVEEYFQTSELRTLVKPETWIDQEPRVGLGTERILDILAETGTKGTFFTLGWVARNHAGLTRKIVEAGHEMGCHSFWHELVYEMSPAKFRQDTLDSIHAIADACGVTPRVYRAPSYSITEKSMWALEILAELGFTHDSSIYPIKHDRYGIPGYGRFAQTVQTPSGPIIEVPIATVQLSPGRVAPVGGGGYLRLLPYRYTAAGLRRINEDDKQPACVYLHPWEVDAGLPRVTPGWIARLRTYSGIKGMEGKLRRLIREFSFETMSAVYPSHADQTVKVASS